MVEVAEPCRETEGKGLRESIASAKRRMGFGDSFFNHVLILFVKQYSEHFHTENCETINFLSAFFKIHVRRRVEIPLYE